MATKDILRIDPTGLAQQLADRPKVFAIFEAVQNSLDAPGVTTVAVSLKRIPNTRRALLRVEDDSPDGWTDLTHAFTMFAPSEKKSNPELRGRMNLGDKLIIALAVDSGGIARIETVKGGVEFSLKGGRRTLRRKRERGSVLTAEIRMSNDEIAKAIEDAALLLVPEGVVVTLECDRYPAGLGYHYRTPLKTIEKVSLATVRSDDDGVLRRTIRQTSIEIHEPIDERPYLYEMGIPVVEIDCEWSINVRQRVPLNMDRDNVTPAYRRKVLALVVNAMAAELEDAGAAWVTEAMASEELEPDAADTVLDKRFGKKRVMFDPSDPDANRLAAVQGYTVVPGRSLGTGVGANLRRFRKAGIDLCQPAGQVTPSRRSEDTLDEDGVGSQEVCIACNRPL